MVRAVYTNRSRGTLREQRPAASPTQGERRPHANLSADDPALPRLRRGWGAYWTRGEPDSGCARALGVCSREDSPADRCVQHRAGCGEEWAPRAPPPLGARALLRFPAFSHLLPPRLSPRLPSSRLLSPPLTYSHPHSHSTPLLSRPLPSTGLLSALLISSPLLLPQVQFPEELESELHQKGLPCFMEVKASKNGGSHVKLLPDGSSNSALGRMW